MREQDKRLFNKFIRWIICLVTVSTILFIASQCKAQCTPGTNVVIGGFCTYHPLLPPVPPGQTRMECFSFQPETQIIHLDYMFAQGTSCGPFQYSNLQVYIYNATCDTLVHYANVYPTQTDLDAVLDTNLQYQMCVNFTATCSLTAICPQYNLSYLPIKLNYWKASLIDDASVLLEWESEYEKDSWFYQIYRADSNFVFYPLYREYTPIYSTIRRYYAYTDQIPPIGSVYYKLIQVDIDGCKTEFDIVSIRKHRNIRLDIWDKYTKIGQQKK